MDNYILDGKLKHLIEQNAKIVDASFEQILLKNLVENEFYQKLWDFISTSTSLESDDARAFAIFHIWKDYRIPYFQLEDGMYMQNEEFKKCSEELYGKIQKARFILSTQLFKQRTSRASVLLDLINSLKTEKEKTVLLAHILSFPTQEEIYSRVMQELLEQLLDN